MSYYYYNRRNGYPWLNENRLNGLYNEYAELNDVAIRNNNIYTANIIDNNKKCCNKDIFIPSIYSMPYYTAPYYSPYYASPYFTSPYYTPYFGGYYGPIRPFI
jgi:hypothetical protein